MNAIPLLSFVGDEIYGLAPIGLSYWDVNNTGGLSPISANGGTIKDFVAWNFYAVGIFGYPSGNMTVDGFVALGDASELASQGGTTGAQFEDYQSINSVFTNADIENEWTGILAPPNTGGTAFTIKNSYFANDSSAITVGAIWSVDAGSCGDPARTNIFNNIVFAGNGANVNMWWYTLSSLASGGVNPIQSDQVFVYNYNGPGGPNFQVYYPEQTANSIVPTPILNGGYEVVCGPVDANGNPVAGLTNTQALAQYAMAIAGAIAPANASVAVCPVGTNGSSVFVGTDPNSNTIPTLCAPLP